MDPEVEAFRAQLRLAGRPYSLWGGRAVGVGLGFLAVAQALAMTTRGLALACMGLLAAALVVMVVGWVLVIIGSMRRQRFARAHQASLPPIPPAP